MGGKLIHTPDDDEQNYLFCLLKLLMEKFGHFQLIKPTNQNTIKVPKAFDQTKNMC